MTHSSRRTIIAVATAMVVVVLIGCVNPFPGTQSTLEEIIIPIGQANAPYPADLDHLDDIPALGKTTLPKGVINITTTPAAKSVESYPGDWGYVITYHTQPQPIRDHIYTYISRSGDGIENYPDTEYLAHMKDTDFTATQRPWVTGFGKVQLVVERPLGRCWLLIHGAPRQPPFKRMEWFNQYL